tara:strand:- start:473 stop:715 length:243 start_codon:yes stop_codon:yes gene_type:complete
MTGQHTPQLAPRQNTQVVVVVVNITTRAAEAALEVLEEEVLAVAVGRSMDVLQSRIPAAEVAVAVARVLEDMEASGVLAL